MRERKTLTLSDFRGVDFSSSPLSVRSNRATDMCNLICDHGKTHKRPGWLERLQILDDDRKPLRINGIFPFRCGERRDLLVHAGRRIFRLLEGANGRETVEDMTGRCTCASELAALGLCRCFAGRVKAERLTDTRSQAFYSGDKMYIVGCGDYLVYGSWDGGLSFEVRRVAESEDVYIPATTVSIGHAGAEEDVRETLDAVNLLTPWRRNRLQGVKNEKGSGHYTWYRLDATVDGVDDKNEIVVEDMVSARFSTYKPFLIYDVDEADERGWCVVKHYTQLALELSGQEVPEAAKEEMIATGEAVVPEGEDRAVAACYYPLVREELNTNTVCGYLFPKSGWLCLENKYWPVDNGDSRIEVRFKHAATAKEAGVDEGAFVPYAERIPGCRFGVMYGIDGESDRLFLSGNPRMKNIDFFSEADDLTYFSDLDYNAVGTSAHAIVGYARLSDSALAVCKEGGGAEATVYYRTGYYKTETDMSGEVRRILAVFPTTAGNTGEAMISYAACADLGGDSLMLSGGGVFGLVTTQNVKTAERYTRERSAAVAARLCREAALSEAVAVCHDGRYYLFVNGHVYVADGRFRYETESSLDGSYQYEWWYWEGVPARVVAVIDGVMWFGTGDGMLCVFDGGATDRTFRDVREGEIAVDVVHNRIDDVDEQTFSLRENDRVIIDTPGLYVLYGEGYQVEGERIFTDEATILTMCDGDEVWADGEGLAADVPYTVDDVDVGDCSFRLLVGSAVVTPSYDGIRSDGFRLHRHVSGRELYVTEPQNGDFSVKLYAQQPSPCVLTLYKGMAPQLPVGRICHDEVIAAHFVTPYFDLGSLAYPKTLLSLSVTAEPGTVGCMPVGYETRREIREHALKDGRAMAFGALSFEEFRVGGSFAHSRTRRLFERGVGYVRFRFRSEDDGDCAPAVLSLIYQYNPYKGGTN